MSNSPGAGRSLISPVVVIMAGGPGERLWPLSRPGRPKPLINVLGETLLHRAYRQALGVTSADDVYVIAQEADRRAILAELPDLEASHFLGEPLRRDTAMAVLVAVMAVARERPQALVVLLPADHAEADEASFREAIQKAVAQAARHECLCLLGTVPDQPRREFGYLVGRSGNGVMRVEQFVEKPDEGEARFLIDEGALWNMGIFIGSVEAFLRAAREAAPDLLTVAMEAETALSAAELQVLRLQYQAAPKVSFDRAVLERTPGIRAVHCSCGWTDLGNWPEFVRFHGADAEAPFIVREPGSPPLQVLGLSGLVVCSTPAGNLVTTKEAAAGVRPLAQDEPTCVPEAADVVVKPWGAEYVWARTDRYAAKLLFVKAGEALSLQYHAKKEETMWVIGGSGILEINGRAIGIGPGSTVTISPGSTHRLEAHANLSVVEVSTPELDDVVRLEDRYGRATGQT